MQNVVQAYPARISKAVFKRYHICSIEQHAESRNTGAIVDDGLFELWFLKEDDIQVEFDGKRLQIPKTAIVGKFKPPSKVIIPNRMTLLSVKLQPYVASFFVPDGRSCPIDLSLELYPKIGELHSKIFSSSDANEQVNHLEDFFLEQPLPNLDELEVSREICNYIYEKQGDINVKDLLERFPFSRQKLNQLFLKQTKNSIKEFATHTRLRAITSHQMNHPNESLTSISYKFGYFDQSHFIKDMKKFTGMSPSEFSKKNNLYHEQIMNKA